MMKRRLSPSDAFLIVANLVPLYGVWFEGWNPREVFVVFCLESIIVGILTIVKMTITGSVKKRDVWENSSSKTEQSALFFILFFIIHFGLFVSIQLIAFFDTSNSDNYYGVGLWRFITHLPQYLSRDAWIMLFLFTLGYAYKNLFDFIFSGRYRTASLGLLLFEPYGRIFIQQFTVILGGIFLAFGAGKIFMLVFVAAKIFILVYVRFDDLIARMQVTQKAQRSSKASSD